MAVTVLGSFGAEFPVEAAGAIVQTKQLWEDQWLLDTELRARRANASVSMAGVGSLELTREYGVAVKSPHQDAMAKRVPIDRLYYYVRVDLAGPGGLQPTWVGRIVSERRTVHSSTPDPNTKKPRPSGVQTWTAMEPAHELTKISVSRSLWVQQNAAGKIRELNADWVPPMNKPSERGVAVGNRTAGRFINGVGNVNGTHFYGGDVLWSRKDYIEYLLAHYIDQRLQNGPAWVLGGQADLLAGIRDSIQWSTTQTLEQMLNRLMPASLGIGWRVEAIPTSPSPGFEVVVFALQPSERSFGGATLPANPQHVAVRPPETPDAPAISVVQTTDRQFDRIRVVGERILVCATLVAAGPTPPSLVTKWGGGREVDYKAGAGNVQDGDPEPDAKAHDEARADDRFVAVYSRFGAPRDWDQGVAGVDGQGLLSRDNKDRHPGAAAPILDTDGKLVGDGADQQNRERSTERLPLFEGWDYLSHPPLNGNAAGVVPERMEPQAWIKDLETGRYVPIAEAGFTLHRAQDDWGILLVSATSRHRLARNHFDGAKPTANVPVYDFDDLVTTIAFRSDQRLTLEFALTSGNKPIGDVIDVPAPGAEFWYLAPNTVVGINPNGTLRGSGQFKAPSGKILGRVLRNDVGTMLLRMAGAIARYNMLRARAEIVFRGAWPWPFLLGQILTVIEQGTGTQFINAPITEVSWNFDDNPTTTIRTGFAR